MATNPPPPAPITAVTTIKDVIDALQSIIDWSIRVESRLGYFAALYKRITIAVRTAVQENAFEDGPRMERLDVAFARRYFDALNGYFHPEKYPKPTRSWRLAFDAASRPEPIIVQHMLAGVNVHIALDLGIAAQSIGPRAQLPRLREDFNRINAVLASQVNGIVADINELSPALADLYAVLADNEIFVLNEAVAGFRDGAWRFAVVLALEPSFARPPSILVRDRQVAAQAAVVYDPPGLVGLIQYVVDAIAARESRDLVHNLRVLDRIAATPAPIATTM